MLSYQGPIGLKRIVIESIDMVCVRHTIGAVTKGVFFGRREGERRA